MYFLCAFLLVLRHLFMFFDADAEQMQMHHSGASQKHLCSENIEKFGEYRISFVGGIGADRQI